MGTTLMVDEKRIIQQTMLRETHQVYIVSIEQMDAVFRSHSSENSEIRARWEAIRDFANKGANYYPHVDDAAKLAKLIGDLGAVTTNVYFKTYRGKRHIVFKGHAGLRRILTGTIYGIQNPKVVSMGLGKAGAISIAKQGGILSIFLVTAYRVIDYFLTDSATLAQLFGALATDILKVGIGVGASLAASVVFGGLTLAIGPLLVVIFVGLTATVGLEHLDRQLGITNHVIHALEELGRDADQYIAARKRQAYNGVNKKASQIIDHVTEEMQVIVEQWVLNKFDEILWSSKRMW